MKHQFYFNKTTHSDSIDSLREIWRNTLVAPQDDMWESFLALATKIEIRTSNQTIGYACLNSENQVLQCFIIERWLEHGKEVFDQLINEFKVTSALVGTNNPVFLALAMPFQQSVEQNTLLFYDALESKLSNSEKPPVQLAWENDQDRLVDFYNDSTGAPKEWLNQYLGTLISRGELYFMTEEETILGTSEVRNSETDLTVADIGMVVSKNHRLKGYGAYLLGKAKELAYDQGRKPICSCEVNNVGSLKSIQKNGFRSIHRILKLSFQTKKKVSE
ncbi:GNAT family N-acetyltransferase [Roseivirga sp. E12]|uniref:GNAT family N-acetyltransferase n=1 Tax=Roseivirga sp. E12 TaxID=2819237 RepID=UPI001ABC6D53|nr:GNAT family N-acetyltransferase [Roseivirga sp. E12]MBO3698102.1 GNAT family N-acetyltransferase [Roseivirga sp. E12]